VQRRFLLALVLLPILALGLSRAPAAHADLIWCFDDPVLVVNGTPVLLKVGVPLDRRGAVVSSSLTVTVPENVTAHLAGASITNFPIAVTLTRSGVYSGVGPVPVSVAGLVVASTASPAILQATRPSVGVVAQSVGSAGIPLVINFGM